MAAGENYPLGIGKHIVCIDAGPSAAAIQTLVGANPEPPKGNGKIPRASCARRKRGHDKDRQQKKDGRHAVL